LGEFDSDAPTAKTETKTASDQKVARRLVLVAPRQLVAGSAADIEVGFLPASNGQNLNGAAEVVLRGSVINGEPARPQEAAIELGNQTEHRTFKVTPGRFTKMRIRVQAFQLGPNPDDIAVAGGMYVDADVAASGASNDAAAFGANVAIAQPE